ncbi:MAG: LacI family DNA-binding transcriptional regulator [Verrucomicrobiae bacterium]|nr:LacI family DNA-binding transcriptional regulator [Verrucomicrobiae bacterium]
MKKTGNTSRNDIARLAGVSGATVTYALSEKDSSKLKVSTRDRIRKIAADLGYKPAFSGKTLATGKSFTIGVLLPEQQTLNSQHCMAIVSGIAEGLNQTEYNLALFFRNELEKCVKSVESGRVDGMIVVQNDANDNGIEKIKAAGPPLVIVDRDYPVCAKEPVACVRADHEKMLSDAFDFFVKNHCRTILNICRNEPAGNVTAEVITRAFAAECQKHAVRNLYGATLAPARNFKEQLRTMFKSGHWWDAFLVDNECILNLLVEVLAEFGPEKSGACKIISHSQGGGRYSCNSFRSRVKCSHYYVQQQKEIGHAAWSLLADLMTGKSGEKKKLIPYKLWICSPSEKTPCYWNTESCQAE